MKVYGTLISERAQKSQGGKSLRVQVQGEDGITLVYLNVNQSEAQPEQYEMSIENWSQYLDIVHNGIEIERNDKKGEKEKSEHLHTSQECCVVDK